MIFGKKRDSNNSSSGSGKTYDMKPDSFLTLPKNKALIERRLSDSSDTLNHPENDLFEEEMSSMGSNASMDRMIAINKQLISFISFFMYGTFIDRKEHMMQLLEMWDTLTDFYKAVKPEFDAIESMRFSQPDVDLSDDTKAYIERFRYYERWLLTWNEIFLDGKR